MKKLNMQKRPVNIEGGRYLNYYNFSRLGPEWEEKLTQLQQKLISRCTLAKEWEPTTSSYGENSVFARNEVQHFNVGLGKGKTGFSVQILTSAYKTAYDAHSGQTRDQGTPYFEHPVAVANILLDELNISDPELICSALLHDVLEDSDLTYEQVKTQFGARIADIVQSVTKNKDESQEQYLNKIKQAGEPSILLKLADRLDNLRSLPLSPKESKQSKYRQNTRAYYLPLAKRFNSYFYSQMEKLASMSE